MQGLRLRRNAPRFASAKGPDRGIVGDGPPLRLLALGDSIVSGVGARTLERALVGRFAAALARRLGRRVEWRAVGLTGARAARVRSRLLERIRDDAFDLVLVNVGVNDATALARSHAWTRDAGELLDAVTQRFPGAPVLVAGFPPVEGFPLLPWPLNVAFGIRAKTFDRLLQDVVDRRESCHYIPTRFEPAPEKFSPDGYHPSEESCEEWGATLAELVEERGLAARGGAVRRP